MIDLKKIVKGKVEHPPKILIYGMDGIGKTTFAAGAPEPFFIDANRGSLEHDVQRVYPENWQEIREYLTAVEKKQVSCRTVVLDTYSDMERSSNTALFGDKSIVTFGGGYGHGKNVGLAEWNNVKAQLDRIWSLGISVIVVGHAQVVEFEDPGLPKYNRFVVSGRPEIVELMKQWCDHVLFCREEIVTVADKGEKARAGSTGVRWMHTKWDPAFDAKSRGGMPPKVLLSWKDFDDALKACGTSAASEGLLKEVQEMLTEIGDAKSTEQVLGFIKQWPATIVESHNRVSNMLARYRSSQKTAEQPKE